MDRVLGFLAERGRALLARLGIGAEENPEGGNNDDNELGTTVRFAAAHESHRLYFQVVGEDATLMVASVPQPIENKISEWRGKLDKLPQAQQASTSAKLDNLAAVANQANTEGDALARQFLAANRDPHDQVEPPNDNALETRERAVAGMLSELFGIFDGEGLTRQWLTDMAAFLPGEGETAMDAPYRDWALRIREFTIGNEPGDEPIWPVGTLDGTRSRAQSYIATESTHRLLLPYFQPAPGDRAVPTVAFSDYVFVQAQGHSVRRNFRTRYGDEVVTRLKSTAAQTVGAATRVDQIYKERLLARLNRMAFHWDSPGGGRIEFPTERVPDHTRYRPLGIQEPEASGIRTWTYRTVTGQQFTATVDSTNDLTISVTGFNLRFMTGRGVTQNSPAFTPNNGFDRSHIIANEFGGSGYAVGRNLVTASTEYNQGLMRNAEHQIGESISEVARRTGRSETEVSFTMTVTVTLGALREAALSIAALGEPDDDAYLEVERQAKAFYAPAGTSLGPQEGRWAVPGGRLHGPIIDVSGSVRPAALFAIGALGPDAWVALAGSRRDLAGESVSEVLLIRETEAGKRIVGRARLDSFANRITFEAAGGESFDLTRAEHVQIFREPTAPAHAEFVRRWGRS